MLQDRIAIKGTSNGLIITIGAGVWPGLVDELSTRLGEKASFFKGGRVALRVGPRQLTKDQLEEVGRILDRHSVTLWALEGESPGTREAAAQLGLEVALDDKPAPTQAEPPTGDSLVVQRTLRSGQVLEHPGHIVVIGDVNPGAEVRAGGSVVIWGRLRGAVHAGLADHGPQAVVCALQLAPSHLRIGSFIALSPKEDNTRDSLPEMAFVQQERIVAEPWKSF